MRKIASAAVALVTMAGLTSAAVSTGTASGTAAAPERTSFTKHYVLGELASRNFGPRTFGGADRIRSRATGKVVGFDAYSGRFFPATQSVKIWVGIALRGGVINARVRIVSEQQERFSGPITGGTGRYRGIEGRVTGRTGPGGRTFVTLRYTL